MTAAGLTPDWGEMLRDVAIIALMCSVVAAPFGVRT